jgi:hypothetical protein
MAVLLGSIKKIGETEKLNLKNLIGKKFSISYGNTSLTEVWDSQSLKNTIGSALFHYLFDQEFYYNYTDNKKAYIEAFKKDSIIPMLKNIDKTLNEYFELRDHDYFANRKKLYFKYNFKEIKNWKDNWFKKNKSITAQMKKEYRDYRKEYYGETIK